MITAIERCNSDQHLLQGSLALEQFMQVLLEILKDKRNEAFSMNNIQ